VGRKPVLTVEQEKEVYELYQLGSTINELAEAYGVSTTTIRYVIRGICGH
jgi:Mor family transcriptional regulator